MRAILIPIRIPLFSSISPNIKRLSAYPVASTKLGNAPMSGVKVAEHSYPLFHSTGLHKCHGKPPSHPYEPVRDHPGLFCQESTRIVPCGYPPPRPSPTRGEGVHGAGAPHQSNTSVIASEAKQSSVVRSQVFQIRTLRLNLGLLRLARNDGQPLSTPALRRCADPRESPPTSAALSCPSDS
jgi:hypothetical protein